ncbi:DNA-directed RNA polymerase subunit beta [Geodia barretti]|uniref:DNA-directed RNA polymerase n=1 Tax=Geodia barretti TaxID=519541 RepID=A0AA35W4K7_GEOBA|nr:DNA-directed RNA polymerase subunit beta [Geodia barretti]
MRFNEQGLEDVFREVSPILDYTNKKYELHFQEHEFRPAKYSPQECKEREITFSQPLYVRTRLVMKETGEIKEQEIFMGDFPMMTDNGTFIINGAERVVVSQLVRSPGIYFVTERSPSSNRGLCMAKLIPSRGAWLEFETSNKDVLSVKVDRKRKVSASTFLRALGVAYDDQITALFDEVDTDETRRYMQATLRSDPAAEPGSVSFREEDLHSLWDWLHEGEEYDEEAAQRIAGAQIEFYRRLRPGEPPSLENSRNLINNLFFEPRRYDLGRVGRYKFNRRLGMTEDKGPMTLTRGDIISVIRMMIVINQGEGQVDDIDHLGNRRVRAVGELVQNQVRVGLLRMERMVKEKMTLVDPETAAPQGLVNIRPVVAAVREFFGGSQLSQERAGFDVRDVHFSHYGRICPIETPEGPNIGLLSSLASYARVNEFGFIESPYRVVCHELSKDSPDLRGRIVAESVVNPENGHVIVNEDVAIGANRIAALRRLPAGTMIKVRPFVLEASAPRPEDSIIWLSADKEEEFRIAQANAKLDYLNQFVEDRIEIRVGDQYTQGSPSEAHLMDVSPMQIMSRQAVPLLRPQSPTVGTGIEERVARDSGQLVTSRVNAVVTSVNGRKIVITDVEGVEHIHPLIKFSRTNQGTCFDQRPIATRGDVVQVGTRAGG